MITITLISFCFAFFITFALGDVSTTASTCACPVASASPSSTPGIAVDGTILVLATSASDAYSASSGFNGYGIPFTTLIVPQNGATLPMLNSSTTHGNFGGIITIGELVYPGASSSALSSTQWDSLYQYQIAFGVRMVRLNAWPSSQFGVRDVTACCGSGEEQLVSISNSTGFPTANLKTGAGLSTQGLYHYPAAITSPLDTFEVAQFAPSSSGSVNTTTTAAVINQFSNGRQQMVFFMGWATQWSQTCVLLQHAYIHWVTRGVFVGARKSYFSTQVDDIHLSTVLFSPANTAFRLRPADLDMHTRWQIDLNNRLPAGSNVFLELGHNGNGDIYNSTMTPGSSAICTPSTAVLYPSVPATDLEFQKPLGTGANVWPGNQTTYAYSSACAQIDQLASWFLNISNRDAFAHVSHTFTHLYLNNATYNDSAREIEYNAAWASQLGLDQGKYSPNGLIPPAITGMHNGDAIQAWLDNGITTVVGDNSRPSLTNQQHEFWPLLSTSASNGADGMWIMGRWPTRIYYDCDLPACDASQWTSIANGVNDFGALLSAERATNTRLLLALRHDPFMMHQANLRAADVAVSTVGPVTGQLSLLQSWVETVTQEMSRLTNWPLLTLKHDDLAQTFQNRMNRDLCQPLLTNTYSSDGKSITGFVVSAGHLNCQVAIPVTVPNAASSSGTYASDQIGSEPTIYWVSLNGSAVSFTFTTAVPV